MEKVDQTWPSIFDASDSSSSGVVVSNSNDDAVSSNASKDTSTSSISKDCSTSSSIICSNSSLAVMSEESLSSIPTNFTSIVPIVARNSGKIEEFSSGSSSRMSTHEEDHSSADLARPCTGCKSSSEAVANCFTCSALLCANCVIAHQLMVAFEGHHVTNLGQGKAASSRNNEGIDMIDKMVKDAKKKLNELQKTIKSVDYSSSRLTSQYEKAKSEVEETFNFYTSMLAERKFEVTKEIEKLYSNKQVALSVFGQKIHDSTDKIEQMISFTEKLLQSASTKDILLFQNSLESRITRLVSSTPQIDLASTVQLEFISNFQAIQVGVRNQFGYIKSGSENASNSNVKPPLPPISRPSSTEKEKVSKVLMNPVMSGLVSSNFQACPTVSPDSSVVGRSMDFQNNCLGYGINMDFANNFNTNASSSPMDILENMTQLCTSLDVASSSAQQHSNSSLGSSYNSSLATPVPPTPTVYPPKAQIRRQKMIYHCKFGEFGILEGQFTEPSGVAVTDDDDIIVADTNNHRIQVFDKEGTFKFQFGEVGKRDGQLLYPNRVAVMAGTGDIVVTERSPTHQVQIFTKFGHFIRKFGADILQHPRGVTTDCWGRIIVVECKVMRVVIFDTMGNVLNKFSCSRFLEFPNGVIVNDHMEIFISDNRAHCVKVFDYQGNYLRQIGGEGVSNFPIGVGLTASGEIAIADNHNNFNLTVFSQSGQLLGALESKVKHAQCFDVALMKDGSIVLASKDYRLYIYRYVKIPNLSA